MWHLGQTLVDGNNNLGRHGGTVEGKRLLVADLKARGLGFECFLEDDVGHVQVRLGVILWEARNVENSLDENSE